MYCGFSFTCLLITITSNICNYYPKSHLAAKALRREVARRILKNPFQLSNSLLRNLEPSVFVTKVRMRIDELKRHAI